jgi:hypothetical protein
VVAPAALVWRSAVISSVAQPVSVRQIAQLTVIISGGSP